MDNDSAMRFVFDEMQKENASYSASKVTAELKKVITASVCDRILLECLRKGTRDNMSAILLVFEYDSSLVSEQKVENLHQDQLESPLNIYSRDNDNIGFSVRLMDPIEVTANESEVEIHPRRKLIFADP